jgi:hypothetical protein
MAYSSSNVLFKDYHGRQADGAKEPLCKSGNVSGIKRLKETSLWLLALSPWLAGALAQSTLGGAFVFANSFLWRVFLPFAILAGAVELPQPSR